MTNPDYLSAAPTPPRPPALRVLWVSVLALFAASLFGLASQASSDTTSSGPEQAVMKLLTAASNSDALGTLEALLPSEREVVRQPIIDLVSEAKRLGLASDKVDLARVDGLAIRFENVKTKTTNLSPDIALVTVNAGTVSSSFDPGRVIGPIFADVGVNTNSITSTPKTEDLAKAPIELAAVRSAGHWYVSIAYSIAESARKGSGKPVPHFGAGIPTRGEATPEAAVDATVRAALALDVEHLIGLVASAEGQALRDYAPLFLPTAKRDTANAGFTATVHRLDLAVVDRSGSRAKVAIKAFDVQAAVGNKPARFAFDGKCTTLTFPGQKAQHSCAGDASKALPFFGVALPNLSKPADLTIAVINENDKWFVSPSRAFTDLLLATTHQLDRKSLTDAIKAFQKLFTQQVQRSTVGT